MIRLRLIRCLLLMVGITSPIFGAAVGPTLEDITGIWFCESQRVLIRVTADGGLTFTPLGEPAVEETTAPLKELTSGIAIWELGDATLRSKFEAGWLEFTRNKKDSKPE